MDDLVVGRSRVDREQILDAATSEFLANGYQNTTVAAVVKRVGGSNRNIYDYFGDKYGLFLAVVERFRDRFMALVDQPQPEDLPVAEHLRAYASHYLKSLLLPEAFAIHRLVVAEAVRFPELGQSIVKVSEEARWRLSDFLKAGVAKGELRVEDPELVARMFLALVRGEVHHRSAYNPEEEASAEDIDAYVAAVVDVFLNGILAHSAAAPAKVAALAST